MYTTWTPHLISSDCWGNWTSAQFYKNSWKLNSLHAFIQRAFWCNLPLQHLVWALSPHLHSIITLRHMLLFGASHLVNETSRWSCKRCDVSLLPGESLIFSLCILISSHSPPLLVMYRVSRFWNGHSYWLHWAPSEPAGMSNSEAWLWVVFQEPRKMNLSWYKFIVVAQKDMK